MTADNDVSAYLDSYVPRCLEADLWDNGLGEFVRSCLDRLDLTMAMANRMAWTLAVHGGFCVSEGIALDVESVLDPDTVERFCLWSKSRYSPATAATMRSRLRWLGRSLTATAPWEPLPPATTRKTLSAPYSSREIDLILGDVSHQATAARSRAATAITLLGLGAGLDARWITKIRGTDVHKAGEHVVVNVPDPSARGVVVRSALADQLLELRGCCSSSHGLDLTHIQTDFVSLTRSVGPGRWLFNGNADQAKRDLIEA